MTVSADRPPTPRLVAPGTGDPLPGATLVGRAEWTGGHVCVLEQTILPGVLVAAHRHERETQGAYVLSGTIGFRVAGEEFDVPAGGFVMRPAGADHALWNATSAPARMLEITSPAADWQAFALELQRLHADGGADDAALTALASRYGTTLLPELTRELCARHGVSAAPGYAPD